MTLHNNNTKAAIILTGGIGITHSGAWLGTQPRKNSLTKSFFSIPTAARKMQLFSKNCRTCRKTIPITS